MLKPFETISTNNQRLNSNLNLTAEEQAISEEKIKVGLLARSANKNLLKISTVFPFDFFPDDLIIDPLKVCHVHRIFFFSELITAILIENVRHIEVASGPFFSTLKIVDNVFDPNIILVKPLFKWEAKKAHAILQGLVLSKNEHIDTTKVTQKTELSAIENLGTPTDSE